MPGSTQQLAACPAGTGGVRAPSAPLPALERPRQGSWRASTDGSHLTRISPAQTEGVESWLAGWRALAEEQGCAASPLETTSMQALLQRVASQPPRRAHSGHASEPGPTRRRPAARASCDFGASVPLQPPHLAQQQWPEGVSCYQQYSAPQPALSDGGSNSAGHGPSGGPSGDR